MEKKFSPFLIIKILTILILLLYVFYGNITTFSNGIDAGLTLFICLILFVRSKDNILVSIVIFFILYCNYSIIIGEYFKSETLGIPIYEVKNTQIYGIAIRNLLIFSTITALFYRKTKLNIKDYNVIVKDNCIIFYAGILMLINILIFGITRVERSTYSVSITPIYEYSSLFFLLVYYYSGKNKIRLSIYSALIIIFVLQDFYYGGRITALQLMLLFFVTVLFKRLTFFSLIRYGVIGIFMNTIVASYRNNFTVSLNDLKDITNSILESYFVFDTPVYSYYASATHIAASEIVDGRLKFESLLEFIKSIFLGSGTEIANVTIFISENYFLNLGGGILPTHFYFWFDWIGVILVSLLVTYFLNRIGRESNDYFKLISIMIVISVPRWYLYSPLALLRGPLVLFSTLFIISFLVNKITVKNSGKVKGRAERGDNSEERVF